MWSTYLTCHTPLSLPTLTVTHLGDAPRAVRARRGVGEIHNAREVRVLGVLDGVEGEVGVRSSPAGAEGEGEEEEASLGGEDRQLYHHLALRHSTATQVTTAN